MKKLTVLAALLLAVSAGTTSFADTGYDPNGKSVYNTDQSKYQTVLITEGSASDTVTDDKIVYADQVDADNNFEAATRFFLKYNSDNSTSIKDGVYTIRFGGSSVTTTEAEFAVGVGISGYDTPLEALANGAVETEQGVYKLGFVTKDGGVQLTRDATILVKIGDTVMAYPIDNQIHITGNVTAILGVQLDDVPAEQKDSVNVYLRQGGSVKIQQQESAPTE